MDTDQMIEISVNTFDSDAPSAPTELLHATVRPKLAAGMLRALADELDPPRPVMRGEC